MVQQLKMDDVDNMLVDKYVYVVVDLSPIPVATLTTTKYVEARSAWAETEALGVILALSPETVAKIKAGELTEILL